MSRNVMVVGSGGREGSLLHKLSGSPHKKKLFCSPGIGNAHEMGVLNTGIAQDDILGIVAFAKKHHIELTVPGPDVVFAAGIADAFRAAKLRIVGPTQAAARVESSKVFAKRQMQRLGIPTAAFEVAYSMSEALDILGRRSFPCVIKLDRLARGTGATPVHSYSAGIAVLSGYYQKNPREAILIEDFLVGHEVSTHALCSGNRVLMFQGARDYKTLNGRNTGGMGAYSPVPDIDDAFLAQVRQVAIDPLLRMLAKAGTPFDGCLYPGLMVTAEGIMVIEYNCRFGDPEAQVFMRRLGNESDLLLLLESCADDNLDTTPLHWNAEPAVCVVLASAGYGVPGALCPSSEYPSMPISGLREAMKVPGVEIFHAGTRLEKGVYWTNGGRVLNVTAVGATLAEARARAYAAVALIHFDGMQYRLDIGEVAA